MAEYKRSNSTGTLMDLGIDTTFSLDEDIMEHRKQIIAKLNLAVSDLSEKQEQYTRMYYFERRDILQIAEECNVSPSTVSRTLARARKNLNKMLKYAY